jgi:hypothetical protein
MLLGLLLIAVSLAMQKGLWGLGQQLCQRLGARRAPRQAVDPELTDERPTP